MNKKVWFYLEAMILLADEMSLFEIMEKGIPAKYVTLAKKNLSEVLNI